MSHPRRTALAVKVGRMLIDEDLMLIELNPVFARPVSDGSGVVAVDAVIRRSASPDALGELWRPPAVH